MYKRSGNRRKNRFLSAFKTSRTFFRLGGLGRCPQYETVMKGFAPRGFWLPSQIVGLAREGSVLHVLQPRSECATVCKCVRLAVMGPWSSILRSDVHITKFVLLIVCRSHCPWPGLTMHVKDFVKAKSGAERAFGSRSDTIDCILPHATSSMTCTLPAKFEPNLVSSQRCRQKVRRCESS